MIRVVNEVLFENQTMMMIEITELKGVKQPNSREASKNGYLIKTKKKMLSRNPQKYESAFYPFR
jgi:hypothetical protein